MKSPFPPDIDWVPVPAPLLGGLLAEIEDSAELKVVLRALWHIHRKKGVLRPVTVSELSADRVVAEALGLDGEELQIAVGVALAAAARRGVMVRAQPREGEAVFVLNIQPEREALEKSDELAAMAPSAVREPWNAPDEQPSIFALYEENIGSLTPIIGERLKEASEQYPESWIRDAVEIAVENNVRNWKYVSAILERWQAEGRGDGEPRRDPEEARQAGYRRAFEKYVRRG